MNKKIGESVKKFVIPSDGKYLYQVRRFIASEARACGFTDNAAYDIKVAVGEACSNAIEHGSPRGLQNKVVITFDCRHDQAVIRVQDEGEFKRQVVEYDANGIHHRGRGMAFMLALMDEVQVKTASSGTEVVMKKIKA